MDDDFADYDDADFDELEMDKDTKKEEPKTEAPEKPKSPVKEPEAPLESKPQSPPPKTESPKEPEPKKESPPKEDAGNRAGASSSRGGRRGTRLKSPSPGFDMNDDDLFDTGIDMDDAPKKAEEPKEPAKSPSRHNPSRPSSNAPAPAPAAAAAPQPAPAPVAKEKPAKKKDKPAPAQQSAAPTASTTSNDDEDVKKLKFKVSTLEREKAMLASQNKSLQQKLQKLESKKGKGGAGEPQTMKPTSNTGSNDSGHLAKSLAMMEARAKHQADEIKKLKAIIAKGESFQVQDLINEGKDKDRQILALTKEIKTLDRLGKINKDQEVNRLEDDIRNLHSQIKVYTSAAVESDRIREQYIKKLVKLREEIKMSKMYKFDPSALG